MKNTTSYSRRGSLHRRTATPQDPAQFAFFANLAVLYIRASTDDQKLTLEGQEFEGRQWATQHGLTISAVFIEPGVSASRPFLKRRIAREAIAHMQSSGATVLMVLNINRGFRDVDDMRETVNFLVDQNMSLRISSPDIDARGGYGKFLATVLVAVAEMQLSETKDQQRRAFNQMRREQVALSQHARFGWQLGAEIPDQTSKSGKPYRRLIPVPEEQTILREIIARYEAREALQSIADDLNARGIRTKQAGQSITYKQKLVPAKGGTTQLRPARTITFSGQWKPQTIKSVIEHAELAQ